MEHQSNEFELTGHPLILSEAEGLAPSEIEGPRPPNPARLSRACRRNGWSISLPSLRTFAKIRLACARLRAPSCQLWQLPLAQSSCPLVRHPRVFCAARKKRRLPARVRDDEQFFVPSRLCKTLSFSASLRLCANDPCLLRAFEVSRLRVKPICR